MVQLAGIIFGQGSGRVPLCFQRQQRLLANATRSNLDAVFIFFPITGELVRRHSNSRRSPRSPRGNSLRSAAMDSPIVAQLFRQLFRHRPQGCQGRLNPIRHAFNTVPRLRSYATRASIDRGMKTNESRWQQRTHILPEDRTEEFAQYPYISMNELKQRSERPRRVKMLLRDFIDGTITMSN